MPLNDGFLLIDKPTDITSRLCLNKVQKKMRIKKAGVEGILDPFASGMLILMFGGATRFVPWLHGLRKTYKARLLLGISTDSYDSEGAITQKILPNDLMTKENMEKFSNHNPKLMEVFQKFTGKIEQQPPAFSNLKVNGKRLRELARSGQLQDIEIPKREVEIFDLKQTNFGVQDNYPWIEFETTVSAGTYIRSLAVDIADALGFPGHLNALRRLSIGDSTEMTDLESFLNQERHTLLPIDSLLQFLPEKKLNKEETFSICQGKKLYIEKAAKMNQQLRLYDDKNKFIGIGLATCDEIKAIRLLPTN